MSAANAAVDAPARTPRFAAAMRVALSYYVTTGISAALGLLLIAGAVRLSFGGLAATAASVGVLVCIPPDQAAPRRGKFWQLLPVALIGLPLFFGVQSLRDEPLQLALLLVPATFCAFLAGAWGVRGAPMVVSIMFALIFSMAVPAQADSSAADSSLFFALGAGLYLIYATAANALLNSRYRVQLLADVLFDLAELMRAQSGRFGPLIADEAVRAPIISRLLAGQAALADHLQLARNLVLESPRTERRRQLAAMLLQVLEMRDHLLACELDLDAVRTDPRQATLLAELRRVLNTLADEVEALGDALLRGRVPAAASNVRAELAALDCGDSAATIHRGSAAPPPAVLARGLANRVGNIGDELILLTALARGEVEPDSTVVRVAWQMFVSPTTWSLLPLRALWHWQAPALRHAVRAALAVGVGYALTFALPWTSHGHWILLTIVVVLRGSLAQTLERRDKRIAGTFLGCVIAAAVLSANLPFVTLLVVMAVAQALAHAFAIRRYLITAVAASVLSLVQVYLLHADAVPVFDVLERMADTLIGVGIAWAFSYVLPSWERTHLPALVERALRAQAQHARIALALGQLDAVDNEPEIEWRLARREAYDSLSALVQATQRALVEPRAVRPPLLPLGHLLTHSHQLLAQLSAIKAMLLMGRGRLDTALICAPLTHAGTDIEAILIADPAPQRLAQVAADGAVGVFSDPFSSDLSPWLLRRLDLATELAVLMRADASEVRSELEARARLVGT